ncbi:aromatic ring-hydroxylating dioxygenase subunit alpha [Acidobacteria bacterium ACD]|nr:MAG: aromatic ring-hydroxylating dioxygenase subunit alpha [Acidobacteriota bacterium]MDL1948327.1 aromatic ring-hydroxylating dioxygenase subunit alpha [Acidobacteria bacterium ACD]
MSDATSFRVDPDVRRAGTLPGRFYADAATFEAVRERVFARSWQLVADAAEVDGPGRALPVTFLPGHVDEPLLLVRDRDGTLRALSNACTHRAALLCETPGVLPHLRCRYHGRRFGLDGRFLSAPGFEGAEGFPRPEDDLARVPVGSLGRLLFAALDPGVPLDGLLAPLRSRCGHLPWGEAAFDASRSRDYLVNASWALYCDNYLEGFHVPFVHPALAPALDLDAYRTELFEWSSLQLGVAAREGEAFDLPAGHPDEGTLVAGWYWWLWPGTMLNVYPWGVSVNLVQPLAPDRTRVRFLSYVWDASRLEKGAGSGLHAVEMEDESVVESVQKGVAARLYPGGRFSPSGEAGVHHFHRLLARELGGR